MERFVFRKVRLRTPHTPPLPPRETNRASNPPLAFPAYPLLGKAPQGLLPFSQGCCTRLRQNGSRWTPSQVGLSWQPGRNACAVPTWPELVMRWTPPSADPLTSSRLGRRAQTHKKAHRPAVETARRPGVAVTPSPSPTLCREWLAMVDEQGGYQDTDWW